MILVPKKYFSWPCSSHNSAPARRGDKGREGGEGEGGGRRGGRGEKGREGGEGEGGGRRGGRGEKGEGGVGH